MLKRLKKCDILLVAVLVCLSLLVYSVFLFLKKDGKVVVVKQDNKIVYSGDLSKNNTITLEHNTVCIEGGKAYMEDSDCKNRICINTGKISKSGETVVCLPNRVIIEIE